MPATVQCQTGEAASRTTLFREARYALMRLGAFQKASAPATPTAATIAASTSAATPTSAAQVGSRPRPFAGSPLSVTASGRGNLFAVDRRHRCIPLFDRMLAGAVCPLARCPSRCEPVPTQCRGIAL